MTRSSVTGGSPAPEQHSGTDIDALGPSDTSDSGSDVATDLNHRALAEGDIGALPISHGSTSDSSGTGERASSEVAPPEIDADVTTDRAGSLPGDAAEQPGSDQDAVSQDARELAADDEAEEEAADNDAAGAGDSDDEGVRAAAPPPMPG